MDGKRSPAVLSSRVMSTGGRLDSKWNNIHSFQEIDERRIVFSEMERFGSANPMARIRMTTKRYPCISFRREGVPASTLLHYCERVSVITSKKRTMWVS